MLEETIDTALDIGVDEIDLPLKADANEAQEPAEDHKILSQIIEGVAIPAFVINKEHIVTHWNKACERLTGNLSDHIIGTQDAWKAFYPEKRPVLADLLVDGSSEEKVAHYYAGKISKSKIVSDAYEAQDFFPYMGKDGKWLRFSATLLVDASRNIIGAIETVQDITESKHAETSLIESEERLRTLINATPDIICFKDGEGRWLEANDADLELFSLTDVDYRGKTDAELAQSADPIHRQAFLGCQQKDKTAFNAKGISRGEETIPCRDGTQRVYDVIKVPLFKSDGLKKGLILLGRDITDRKLAEEVLRESEEKLRQITSSAQDAIIMMDNLGRITFWNESAEKISGYSKDEVLLRELHKILAPKHFREKHLTSIAKFRMTGEGPNINRTTELSAINKDGTEFPIELSLSSVKIRGSWHAIGIIRDVSNRKRAEAARKELDRQLQHSSKMAAIGTLASGIAHDFNNILSAIMGYSELALTDLPPESSLKYKLDSINSSGKRARDLIAQILAFSRQDEHSTVPVMVHLIITDALRLLRPAIPTTIEIRSHITSKCCVLGDPSRLHRVIMNLCTNAYQAMLETGGTLSLALSKIDLKNNAAHIYGVPSGPYAELSISDTGIGIPSKNLDRIFEPYFTTKQKDEGTGLGLSTVHGIVTSHGGSVCVDSKIGKGTTFTVLLPITQDSTSFKKPAEPQITGGNENILLVDDERVILEVEKEMLTRLGYSVVIKDDVQEALNLFSVSPEKFDLIVTDRTMPKMTGEKLANRVKSIRRDIPVLLCTGCDEIIVGEKGEPPNIDGFLKKPITMEDLSAMVRELLDRAIK